MDIAQEQALRKAFMGPSHNFESNQRYFLTAFALASSLKETIEDGTITEEWGNRKVQGLYEAMDELTDGLYFDSLSVYLPMFTESWRELNHHLDHDPADGPPTGRNETALSVYGKILPVYQMLFQDWAPEVLKASLEELRKNP